MCSGVLPALYGVFAWWCATGLALLAVGLAGRAPVGTALGAVAVFAGALAALAATAQDTGVGAAYVAFTAAIFVWGVQEIAFLAGWITGPRPAAPPAASRGWTRAGYAVAAILYHELALAASLLVIMALTWGAPNQVGFWTFAVLFGMRISAKLNVFLGVPNLTDSFLPPHLDYLKSYFSRRPMNLLFPVSVTASTVLLVALVGQTWDADDAAVTPLALLATLVALGLLEHWFLVLPLPVEALWSWGLSSPETAAAPTEGEAPAVVANVVRLDQRIDARAGSRGRTGFRSGQDPKIVARARE